MGNHTDKPGHNETEKLPELPSHSLSPARASSPPTKPSDDGPQLDRSLSWLGAIGLAFTITNSWMSYAATFGPAVVYGGGITVLFGLMGGAVAQWVVLLGVSELASAIPSSGGCYHFTYFVAPKQTRKFASFVVGLINLMGFWIGGVSAMTYTAISVVGIVSFWIEGFTPHQWQIYLGYVGVICLSLIPIFTIPRKNMKHMTSTCLAMSIFLLFLFVVVLLAMGRGQYKPENLVLHRNRSGWSNATGWLLSITLGQYSFSAAGTVVHLAEEVPRPRRDIPLAINTTVVLGISTAIPFTIVLLSNIQDIDAVQNAWLPCLEAFYQATGNRAVATVLQACLAFLYFNTVTMQWVSVSRIAWTLSRDNLLPFSTYWNHIDPHYGFPVRTTLLSAGFCIVFGLLNVASTTAFNSVVNMTTLLVNIAFTVPQGILACRQRTSLSDRPFHLGRAGYIVNIFSVLWLVFSGVLFCFPNRIPTTPGSMN